MTETEKGSQALPSLEEIQQRWLELTSRVGLLEAEREVLERENKALRFQLEKVIAHRQTSHGELVILLTNLVTKLPLNDVGTIVARLVEHNTNVSHYLSALAKGTAEQHMEQPDLLKTLEQNKRDLAAAITPLVQELIDLDSPIETSMLEALRTDHEAFFSPPMVRATRCFLKGQVPKERVVRQFGPEALVFFNDLTTDPKLNPRPKQEEIVLAFRNDFESVFQQQTAVVPEKRPELLKLYEAVQKSRAATPEARQQKNAFLRLSFFIELLHYYEHQSTENPEVIYAHRLPALVEQLIITSPQDGLDPKLIEQAESLIGHVINPDHRQMIINNIGKGDYAGRTLRFVMKLRTDKVPEMDQVISEFLKHLITPGKPPKSAELLPIIRLIHPTMQRFLLRSIMTSDRLRRDQGEALARELAAGLGVTDFARSTAEALTPEVDRQLAWAKIKDMIARRGDAAKVAAAIRDRLHAKYDADEIRQSWITLTEADPMSLIRIFCQLPYADGKTDPIARPVMETYVSRLTHEKYASTYQKVVRSLRNMFTAKADSPTLLNFTALFRWVSPEAADKLAADIGMQVHA